MALKRQRTVASSSSSRSYDHTRFVSEAAFHRYNDSIVKRTIVKERGMEFTHGPIYNVVARRNWQELVKQPEAGVVPLIHEFYANAAEASNYRVFVRGKQVKFDRATINRIYGLPNIDNDEYLQYLEDPDRDEVIRSIARPGATWKCNRGIPAKITRQDLDRNMRAWQYFISVKLMPTTHLSDVLKDRAILMHCIVRGKTVDVGRIIQNSIQRSIKSSTTGGLCHPALITILCRQMGVAWGENEVLIHPQRVIDQRLLRQFRTWNEAGEQAPVPDDAHPPDSPNHSILVHIEQMLIHQQRELHSLNHFAHRVETFMEYQIKYNSFLTNYISQMNNGNTSGLAQLPPPPVLPDYPLYNASANEEEEENDEDEAASGADSPDETDDP